MLKNSQPVLMKIYFDAGLKQLANLAGHRGETMKALANCTTFKRTHRFILKSWEAFYMYMYEEFLKTSENSEKIQMQMRKLSTSGGSRNFLLGGHSCT